MSEWIDEKEAQRFMCCGRTTLWMMVRDGKVTKRKLGGKNVYSREELGRYMDALPRVGGAVQ